METVLVTLDVSRDYFYYRVPRYLSQENQLSKHPVQGITAKPSGVLSFSREFFTEQMAVTASCILSGLSVQSNPLPYALDADGKAGEIGTVSLDASKDDLAIINASHAVKTLKAEEVRIYERYVINNAPTRGMLWFTNRALDKLVADYAQGRSRLLHHDRTRIIGRTFAAEVAKSKKIRGLTADWVKVREYLPNTPSNQEHILNRDNGIYAFDSIGFGGGKVELVEKKLGEKTLYFLQIDYDPAELPALEAGEVSDVFLGNVFGAGNDKQQSAGDSPAPSNTRQGETSPVMTLHLTTNG